MIELRVLSPDDWPLWRRLRLAALAESPQAFGSRLADWQGEGDREERWRARLSIAGGRDFIAFVDGEAVGMASGVPAATDKATTRAGGEAAAHSYELISLWVAPPARGRGVGDRLVAAVIAFARAQGARAVRLAVKIDNAAAQALYARHGFVAAGIEDDEQIFVHPLAP